VRIKRNKTNYPTFIPLDIYQKTATLQGLLSDLKALLGSMDSLDTAVAFIVLPSTIASAMVITKTIETSYGLSSILFIEKFAAGQDDNRDIDNLQSKGYQRVEYPKLKPVVSDWSGDLRSHRANEELLAPVNLAFHEVLEKAQKQFMDLLKKAEKLPRGGEQPKPTI
jgi:hypothetical protein